MVECRGYLYVYSAGGSLRLFIWCLQVLVLKTLAMGPDLMMMQSSETPCRGGSEYYTCYDCKTNNMHADDFCGDPFNSSHPSLNVVQCGRMDLCAKWVVRLESGAKQTSRTCSGKMRLNLRIYAVCMQESGNNGGHLCFCDGELCNFAGTSPRPVTSLVSCVVLLAGSLLTLLATGTLSVWT